MKKLRKDNDEKPRLEKSDGKKKRKYKKSDIEMFLIMIILFLILFIIIPLLMYSSGCLDSTNYYYRLHTLSMVSI